MIIDKIKNKNYHITISIRKDVPRVRIRKNVSGGYQPKEVIEQKVYVPSYEAGGKVKRIGKGGQAVILEFHNKDDPSEIICAKYQIFRNTDLESLIKSKKDTIERYNFVKNLNHKNIISYIGFDVSDIQNDSFDTIILMPKLQTIQNIQSLCVSEVFKIAMDIASALNIVHKKGGMHRDLKPSNILYNPFTSNYVLSDFDTSKILRKDSTMTANAGTQYYDSPEVHKCQYSKISHKSDIYSYGITLYVLLSGGLLPHQTYDMNDNQYNEIYNRLMDNKIKVNANKITRKDLLDDEEKEKLIILKKIINKCCQYRPQQRYNSMNEIIDIKNNDKSFTLPVLLSSIHFIAFPYIVNRYYNDIYIITETISPVLNTAFIIILIILLAVYWISAYIIPFNLTFYLLDLTCSEDKTRTYNTIILLICFALLGANYYILFNELDSGITNLQYHWFIGTLNSVLCINNAISGNHKTK